MKVTLLNATDATGGAAIAARRLMDSLRQKGVDANMLVEKIQGEEHPNIQSIIKNPIDKVKYYLRVKAEEGMVTKINPAQLYNFSPGLQGVDVTKHPLIKDADIIHLHWVNHGFLSIESIGKLLQLDKPIVWTFHDMWPFTGGCHHSRGCMKFTENCGDCPILKTGKADDLSSQILALKKKKISTLNLTALTPSSWLGGLVNKSDLLEKARCFTIPNAVNTDVFSLRNKEHLRKKYNLPLYKNIILFGAVNALTNKQKGIDYLVKAMEVLAADSAMGQNTILCIFGEDSNHVNINFPLETKFMGKISSPEIMAEMYSLADVFVLPSLEENLPNTIMEAMSCGTPTVAYNVGGIPDLIAHKSTGYLAEYLSVNDLAKGLFYCISVNDNQRLGNESRRVALLNYSQDAIAEKHLTLYKSLMH
ncbi:MAG: glycosyltransferase family 4 protein [Bacteroidetes bacterium]|nr:glycosyltransferase family 4 protein [Bacteroidota bacterium]